MTRSLQVIAIIAERQSDHLFTGSDHSVVGMLLAVKYVCLSNLALVIVRATNRARGQFTLVNVHSWFVAPALQAACVTAAPLAVLGTVRQ